MLSTATVANLLNTTVRTVRRAAETIRDTSHTQFGTTGRGTMYYSSDEIDAIAAQIADPAWFAAYGN